MELGADDFLLTLVLVLPGFVTTLVERAFQPRRFAEFSEWLAVSVLRSLWLNLLVLAAFVWWTDPGITDLKLSELADHLNAVALQQAALYVAAVYAAAPVWGVLKGTVWWLSFRAVLARGRWSKLRPFDNVWNDVLRSALTQPGVGTPTPWVRVSVGEGRVVLGRLRKSSVHVDRDKPIEVYLSPAYEVTGGPLQDLRIAIPGIHFNGIYLRIGPETFVEIYATRPDWAP